MICLTSEAGLCNRLRALGSAILLSRAVGHDLKVWWHQNRFCAAAYADLFAPIPLVDTHSSTARVINQLAFSKRRSVTGLRGASGFSRWGTTLEGKLDYYFYKDHTPLSQAAVDGLARRNLICIRSDDGWFYPEDFSWLVPLPGIRHEIDTITAGFTPGIVGMHVRRGDHASAIAENPTDAFIDAMHERLVARPDTRFYLATDDTVLRTRVSKLFPGSVIAHVADTSRETAEGVRSAVVDLFCLAGCSEIWGTHGSSFSETAHHMGNAPLTFPARRPKEALG